MRIDLGFSLIGDRDGQVDKRYVSITRKDVLKRVNEHPALDQWVKDHLTKKINEYPDHALVFFVKNIDKIVRTALEERSRTLLKENNDQKDLDEASSESENNARQQSGTESFGRIEEGKEKVSEERENFFSKRTSS